MKKLIIFCLFVCGIASTQEVTLYVSGYNDDAGILDIYIENPYDENIGFMLTLIHMPGFYCENTNIDNQVDCELSGHEWFWLDGQTDNN